MGQSASNEELLIKAKKDVAQLCSNEFAGRGYQQEGHIKAAHFIQQRFKDLGLKPIPGKENETNPYFQPFSFTINKIDSAEVLVNGKRLIPGVEYIVFPGCGGKSVKGKVSDAGYGFAREYTAASGSAVVIHEGLPPKYERKKELKEKYGPFKSDMQKIGVAANLNAPGVILLKNKLTASFAAMPVEIPVIEVLADKWPKKAKLIDIQVFRGIEKINSQNVIGYIPGSRLPDSVIVVSAHYDHLGKLGTAIFRGANDNASGISMMLSMAEYFSKAENRPECSMVFIGFGGEETGLIGSRYYVEKNPVFSLERIRFLLNLDLMGNGDEGITAVAGLDFPVLFDLLKSINENQKAIPAVNGRNNASNSDHYFFVEKGVRGMFIYTLGGPKHYHDVFDTPENLVFSKYIEIRQLLLLFLIEIGRMP